MNKILILVCAALFMSTAVVRSCIVFMRNTHTYRMPNVVVDGGNFQSAVVLATAISSVVTVHYVVRLNCDAAFLHMKDRKLTASLNMNTRTMQSASSDSSSDTTCDHILLLLISLVYSQNYPIHNINMLLIYQIRCYYLQFVF